MFKFALQLELVQLFPYFCSIFDCFYSIFDCFYQFLTVIVSFFPGIFGLSPDLMMDLLCLIGTAIGACAAFWPSYGNKIAFIVMWLMYQSLYQVGETFLWFQWDILLLEVSDHNKDG